MVLEEKDENERSSADLGEGVWLTDWLVIMVWEGHVVPGEGQMSLLFKATVSSADGRSSICGAFHSLIYDLLVPKNNGGNPACLRRKPWK